jgi:hypothetical protein
MFTFSKRGNYDPTGKEFSKKRRYKQTTWYPNVPSFIVEV